MGMSVRQLIRKLLETQDLTSEVKVVNVNDKRDEYDNPEAQAPVSDISHDPDSNTTFVYFVGDKPERDIDRGD